MTVPCTPPSLHAAAPMGGKASKRRQGCHHGAGLDCTHPVGLPPSQAAGRVPAQHPSCTCHDVSQPVGCPTLELLQSVGLLSARLLRAMQVCLRALSTANVVEGHLTGVSVQSLSR